MKASILRNLARCSSGCRFGAGSRRRAARLGIVLLGLLLSGVAGVAQAQPKTAFEKLQDQYLGLATGLVYSKPSEVPGYAKELPKNIQIDNQWFFNMIGETLSSEDVVVDDGAFSRQELRRQDNIPFKITGRTMIVSAKIHHAPESQFYFYMTFMKVYAGLHPSLQQQPNVLTTGICALLAQEFTYRSTLAVLPRFAEEATLANLIHLYDPEVARMPFEDNFDLGTFKSRLNGALAHFTDISAERLLSMKEGFTLETVLGRAHPEQLEALRKDADSLMRHLTLRYTLYNALQERQHCEPAALARVSQRLTDAFFNELATRYGRRPVGRLPDLRFEKNTFGVLFQFVYNSSTVIPDTLRAKGLNRLRLDDPVLVAQHEAAILAAMQQEAQLEPLLSLLGLPEVVLREKTSDVNVLGFQWALGRKITSGRDRERIDIEFDGRPVRALAGNPLNPSSVGNPGENPSLGGAGVPGGKTRDKREPGGQQNPRGVTSGGVNPTRPSGQGRTRIGDTPSDKGDKESPTKLNPDRLGQYVQEANLTRLTPPDAWGKNPIHLTPEDLDAIRALDGGVRQISFGFSDAAVKHLNKREREELLRFLTHFVDYSSYRDPSLEELLPPLTRATLSAYLSQRDSLLRRPDIRIVRHLIRKFVFLTYVAHVFNLDQTMNVLNQDMLEITLRTMLSQHNAEYEGYEHFADLGNTLVYALKYTQDMRYFYRNTGARGYEEVTLGVTQNLADYLRARIPVINGAIGQPSLHIALNEVLTGRQVNLRNLIIQLEKIKYTAAVPSRSEQTPFQKPCSCQTPSLNVYHCQLLADEHVVTGPNNAQNRFGPCFGKFFALNDTKSRFRR